MSDSIIKKPNGQTESYGMFQLQLLALVTSCLWRDAHHMDITVVNKEDRLFELTLRSPGGEEHYAKVEIPKIPNEGEPSRRLAGHAATTHMYEHVHIGLPIQKLEVHDFGVHNILESPFVLQKRTLGKTVKALGDDLTHEKRLRLAKELGELYNRILNCGEVGPGTPKFTRGPNSEETFTIQPFYPSNAVTTQVASGSTTYQLLSNYYHYVGDVFSRPVTSHVQGVQNHPPIPTLAGMFKAIPEILEEMENIGYFKQVKFVPVNPVGPTLVSVDETNGSLVEYRPGALGFYGPDFMACQPPVWLWNQVKWNVNSWVEETKEHDPEPKNTLAREVKAAFDQAAGDKFVKYAYDDVWIYARRLARFIIEMKGENEEEIRLNHGLNTFQPLRMLKQTWEKDLRPK